jgi:hypothetical protein
LIKPAAFFSEFKKNIAGFKPEDAEVGNFRTAD